jgi:type I restriction enzyme S subunit
LGLLSHSKIAIARNLNNGLGFGSTEFYVIRPKDGIIPEFIYYFIRQECFRNFAARHMTSTVGQLRVLRRILEEVYFPLAPIEEQKRILNKIHELFSLANQIEKPVEEAKKRVNKIDTSILTKAFHAELVSQDPNDEPVSIPLERIKSERKKRSGITSFTEFHNNLKQMTLN